MQRVEQLVEKRDENAEGALAEAVGALQRLGLRSAYVTWLGAILADRAGQLESAFKLVEEALVADPVAPPYVHSRNVILERMRRELSRGDRDDADASTPRLWALLAHAGSADVSCHLKLAAYHAATGALAEAASVVHAVVLLNPDSPEAWAARSLVERRLGRDADADRSAAEAARLGCEPIPFSVPGEAAA